MIVPPQNNLKSLVIFFSSGYIETHLKAIVRSGNTFEREKSQLKRLEQHTCRIAVIKRIEQSQKHNENNFKKNKKNFGFQLCTSDNCGPQTKLCWR